MREPFGKVPLAQIQRLVFFVKKDHAHIRVAVRRAELGADDVHQLHGTLAALSSRDADQGMVRQVQQDGYFVECLEIVMDITGLVAEFILQNMELLLGDIDPDLEGDIAGADPDLQEILLPAVAVPESAADTLGQKTCRRGIHLPHGLGIALVFFTDLVRLVDQVIAVGLKAPVLLFLEPSLLPVGVGDGQNGCDTAGGDCHHQAGVHHDRAAVAGPAAGIDHQKAGQHHGDDHGDGLDQGLQNGAAVRLLQLRSPLDLDRAVIDPGQDAGGAVKQRSGLFFIDLHRGWCLGRTGPDSVARRRMPGLEAGLDHQFGGARQDRQIVSQIHKTEPGDLDRISIFQEGLTADGLSVQIEGTLSGDSAEAVPVSGQQNARVFNSNAGGDPQLVFVTGPDPDPVETCERNMERGHKEGIPALHQGIDLLVIYSHQLQQGSVTEFIVAGNRCEVAAQVLKDTAVVVPLQKPLAADTFQEDSDVLFQPEPFFVENDLVIRVFCRGQKACPASLFIKKSYTRTAHMLYHSKVDDCGR